MPSTKSISIVFQNLIPPLDIEYSKRCEYPAFYNKTTFKVRNSGNYIRIHAGDRQAANFDERNSTSLSVPEQYLKKKHFPGVCWREEITGWIFLGAFWNGFGVIVNKSKKIRRNLGKVKFSIFLAPWKTVTVNGLLEKPFFFMLYNFIKMYSDQHTLRHAVVRRPALHARELRSHAGKWKVPDWSFPNNAGDFRWKRHVN